MKHERSQSTEDVKQPSPKRVKDSDGTSVRQGKNDNLKHPTIKRAKEIDAHTPMQQLDEFLENARKEPKSTRNVLHWFRSNYLRKEDNRGLHAAAEKADEGFGSLTTVYLFSPKDMEWHGSSAPRTDFILDSLEKLKVSPQKKNIPLAVVTAEERGQKVDKVMQFVKNHDISHIYANLEYEVDELRRDIKLAKRSKTKKTLLSMPCMIRRSSRQARPEQAVEDP
jgi:deoxyribodipyrimidine photo-lyase